MGERIREEVVKYEPWVILSLRRWEKVPKIEQAEIERLIDYFNGKYDELWDRRWDPYVRGLLDGYDEVIAKLEELL